MSYKDKYRSIQINVSKSRHNNLLKWLEKKCREEERSFNSFIINLLKKEYEKDEAQGDNLQSNE